MSGSARGIGAVILAAGLSSRMKEFKPLLPLGGGTVLSQVVSLFRLLGTERVMVVTGKRGEEVAEASRLAGATAVHNAEYEQGMFTSVQAGVQALPEDVEAFFLLPVDIPLVRPETIKRMLDGFADSAAAVLYPRFFGERGHPPLMRRSLVPDILRHDGKGGLRTVLERFEEQAMDLDVADFGVSHDLDHPKDYQLALEAFGREYPSQEEAEALLAMHAVTDHIIGHCRAVSRVAVALSQAWNGRTDGPPLNVELVRGAALTHDVGKGNKRHEAMGGALLRAQGFPAAAEIVEAHFDLILRADQPITEREIVFLADKLVRCHGPVPLEQRYLEKVAMYAHEEGAQQAIMGRLERAKTVLERFNLESCTSAEQLAKEALA